MEHGCCVLCPAHAAGHAHICMRQIAEVHDNKEQCMMLVLFSATPGSCHGNFMF